MKIEYPGSLHNHTDYSNFRLPDAYSRVDALIDTAIALGHETIAITEHETVASSVAALSYYKKVKEKHPNFKLILGNEIYLCRDGLNGSNFKKGKDKYYHFILLAKDEIGHKQIRELSTRAWMRSYVSRGLTRVPTYYSDLFEVIGANPGHVVGSSACLGGVIGTQLLNYRKSGDMNLYAAIKSWCTQLQDLFGKENFYLEMQPSNNAEQIFVNKEIIKLSKELGIPTIITTDSHYLTKDDRLIHKAYLNSKEGEREVDDFYATTYLMGTEEILSFFDYLEDEDVAAAFANIKRITDMCEDYTLDKPLKIPRLYWKDYNESKRIDYWVQKIPYLKTFLESPHEADRYLAHIIMSTLDEAPHLQEEENYKEIDYCLDDIWVSSAANDARWSAYLLNLQNIIEVIWGAGSLVGAGRGSGVGFILLYILGITQINPLKETTKTYRFRFLNPERVSPLD